MIKQGVKGSLMKVMHVMAGADTGGAENIFLESVVALAEADVEQYVVTRDNNDFRLQTFERLGIPVSTARFPKHFRFATRRSVVSAIARFRPDVIEYWMRRAGTYAPRKMRARNVGWYGGYYQRARFKHCDWHVGLTPDLLRHITDQGVPWDKATIIHTYADFINAAPIDRASLDTPKDKPVLLALARLHVKKGLDILLDSVAEIPGAYVWIAGEGPLENQLKTQARILGIEDRVRFLGWRDDRDRLLAACDIVAFPSRYEPFGTVTVDAWAARKPLIAAASQGPGAFVTDGENGLLIPINDTDALTDAIRRMIANPALRQQCVAGGTRSFEELFTRDVFIRDSLAFYEKVKAYADKKVGAWK